MGTSKRQMAQRNVTLRDPVNSVVLGCEESVFAEMSPSRPEAAS
jgi:hypothetical protein